MGKFVVIGCGFVGSETARLLASAGREVIGVTHSRESAEELGGGSSFPVIACDITDRASLQGQRGALGDAEALIHCASAGRGGGAEAYRRVYFEGMRNVLAALAPRRVVWTGSTSVYAQTDGALVTEESPAEPRRETGRILRETENLVLAANGVVARLAGIYGPGRTMLLRKFLDGSAVIEGDGMRIINQVHRDDAARALLFLAENGEPGGVFNVCDDSPAPQAEVYRWIAGHLSRPMPPAGPIDLDRKRGWTSKRVSNAKLRRLGWAPLYPSLQAALANDPRLVAEALLPRTSSPAG